MNLMFAGDFHIREKDLEECKFMLNEIAELCKKYNVGKLFITGDTFDRINPTPNEIDLFSNFLHEVNLPTVIIAAQSHESISSTESIMNHFGILKSNVWVVKEYHDMHNEKEYLFVGHFIITESKKNVGGTVSKDTLKKYRYVVLGHGHSFEEIVPNVLQLGASRYVDFAESNDKAKVVLLMENYKDDLREKCHFLGLKSVYRMQDIYFNISDKIVQPSSISVNSQEGLRVYLDQLDSKTKTRIIFNDFASYSLCYNDLEKYRSKFVLFKERKDFMLTTVNSDFSVNHRKPMRDSLRNYLKDNKIDINIQNILLNETS